MLAGIGCRTAAVAVHPGTRKEGMLGDTGKCRKSSEKNWLFIRGFVCPVTFEDSFVNHHHKKTVHNRDATNKGGWNPDFRAFINSFIFISCRKKVEKKRNSRESVGKKVVSNSSCMRINFLVCVTRILFHHEITPCHRFRLQEAVTLIVLQWLGGGKTIPRRSCCHLNKRCLKCKRPFKIIKQKHLSNFLFFHARRDPFVSSPLLRRVTRPVFQLWFPPVTTLFFYAVWQRRNCLKSGEEQKTM